MNDTTTLPRRVPGARHRTTSLPTRPSPTSLATLVAALLLMTLGTSSARADTSGTPSDDAHPAPFTWTNGQVMLRFAGEAPTFWVSSVQDGRVNISASAVGLAEVTPQGAIVAFSGLSEMASGWNLTWSNTSSGVLVRLHGTPSVAATSGTWNVSEPPEGVEGNATAISVSLTFHLSNVGGATGWKVKFDVQVSGWNWQSPADRLGLVLSTHAAPQTNLATGSSGDDVEESGGNSGAPIATLSWGPTASADYPSGSNASLGVVSYVMASGDDQSSTVDLLFVGAPGGYSSLFYDPTVSLSTLQFPKAPLPAWVLTPPVLGTIAAAALLAVVLGVVAVRTRAKPTKDALSSFTAAVERGGTRPPGPACRRCGRSLIPSALTGVRVLSCPRCST